MLQAASPVQEWTSLGVKDAGTLLAGADGSILELTRRGSDWSETKRWNSWAEARTSILAAAFS